MQQSTFFRQFYPTLHPSNVKIKRALRCKKEDKITLIAIFLTTFALYLRIPDCF